MAADLITLRWFPLAGFLIAENDRTVRIHPYDESVSLAKLTEFGFTTDLFIFGFHFGSNMGILNQRLILTHYGIFWARHRGKAGAVDVVRDRNDFKHFDSRHADQHRHLTLPGAHGRLLNGTALAAIPLADWYGLAWRDDSADCSAFSSEGALLVCLLEVSLF
jgi:hypothetical protein